MKIPSRIGFESRGRQRVLLNLCQKPDIRTAPTIQARRIKLTEPSMPNGIFSFVSEEGLTLTFFIEEDVINKESKH